MNKTWGGNTYKNVTADTKPVYAGSSSPKNYGSSGSSGSGGSKKKSSKKSSGGSTSTQNTQTQIASSGGGGGSSSSGNAGSNSDYLKKLQKLAKKIYNQNMKAIDETYTGAGNTLRTNYDSTTGELSNKYGYQKGNINTDADNSMRQAYINSMLQKKDLGQRMAAQGLSGGATETTMASLNNNYSNARNNIDTTRQRSLSDLEQTYQSNVAQAERQYNSAVQQLAMQRAEAEQAARNAYLQLAMNYQFNPGSLSMPKTDYASAINSQSNFSFNPTEANNAVSGVNTVQGNPDAVSEAQNNYARYLAQQRAAGASDDSIKGAAYSALQNGQISGSDLISILNQLGIRV